MILFNRLLGGLLFGVCAIAANGQLPVDHRKTQASLEVLSVRAMDEEERWKEQGDNIGVDILIRYRLCNNGKSVLKYFASWKGDISPAGFTVHRDGNRIRWFTGMEELTDRSLGIKHLTKLTDGGQWLELSSRYCVEYEHYDSSISAGQKHAQTIFIIDYSVKKGEWSEKNAYEVVSDSYLVPAKAKSK
jgi:hypothetical protein